MSFFLPIFFLSTRLVLRKTASMSYRGWWTWSSTLWPTWLFPLTLSALTTPQVVKFLTVLSLGTFTHADLLPESPSTLLVPCCHFHPANSYLLFRSQFKVISLEKNPCIAHDIKLLLTEMAYSMFNSSARPYIHWCQESALFTVVFPWPSSEWALKCLLNCWINEWI